MAEPVLKRPRESGKGQGRACDTCRSRKVACDKALPSCSSCVTFEVLCTYSPPTVKRGRPRLKPYTPAPGRSDDGRTSPAVPGPSNMLQELSAQANAANADHGFESATFLASLRSAPLASSSQTPMIIDDQRAPSAFSTLPLRDGRYENTHAVPDSAGPSRASSPIPLAAGPAAGIENIVPLNTVTTLVDIFFTILWIRLPILHRPTFASKLAARVDRTDALFYQLVANVCAVTCVWNRNLPLLRCLQDAGFLTWEDAGRRFNTATVATGHRIHQIVKAGTTICVQNILLVATFEKCLSSKVADRLFGEAERIALASHFDRANDKLDPGQDEIRRRIYWVLYINDKVRALVNNQPMLLRSDEASTELPRILLADENPLYTPEGIPIGPPPSLADFNAVVAFCQAAENSILQWKKHPSGSLPATEPSKSLNDCLANILALSIERKDHGPGVVVLTHSIRIELYHRYARLQSDPSQNLLENLARTGERLARELSTIGYGSLLALGPTFITLVDHSYHRLHSLAGTLKDPFSASEAAAAAESLRELLDQALNPTEATVCNGDEQRPAPASSATYDQSRTNCAQVLADQALDWPSAAAIEGMNTQDPSSYFAGPGVGTLDFLHDLSFMTFDNLSPQFDPSTTLWP